MFFFKFVKKFLNWPAFAPIKSGGGINFFDGFKFFHYLFIGSCILHYHLGLTFDGQHFGAFGFCQSIYVVFGVPLKIGKRIYISFTENMALAPNMFLTSF